MGRSVVVLALTAVLAACSAGPAGPTPDEFASAEAERRFAACDALARDIRDTLQRYIDQFAPADAVVEGDLDAVAPSLDDLRVASSGFRERLAAIGCRQIEFAVQLDRALDTLTGVGPVGRAVVPIVRDSVDVATGPPTTVRVAPGDDLADAVHGAMPGAVVELAPGRHELDEPLVALRAVHLRGAGSQQTEVVSSSPGVVTAFLGGDGFRAEGVSFAHEGSAAASVLVLSSGGYELRDVAVSGGVSDGAAVGWGLVVGGGDGPTAPDGTTAVQVIDRLRASDNGAGGVVLVADREPTVTDITVTGNGSCGLCWFGDAAGTVDGAVFVDNDVAMTFSGSGAPAVADVTVSGSRVLGLLVEGTTGGSVSDLEIDTPPGARAGIGIRGKAAMTVERARVTGGDEVVLLVEGSASPTITDVALGGAPVGLVVRGAASVTVDGLDVRDVGDSSVVLAGDSSGRLADVSCAPDLTGIVLLEATTVDVDDAARGAGCDLLDQRGGPSG